MEIINPYEIGIANGDTIKKENAVKGYETTKDILQIAIDSVEQIEEIIKQLPSEKPNNAERGPLYRHYKGGVYEFLGYARHTETGEVLVIYRNVETAAMWARPEELFCGKTETGIQRFEMIIEENKE